VRTAAGTARTAQAMITASEPLPQVWRHVILQTIDEYDSARRHPGLEAAAALFDDEPPRLCGFTTVEQGLEVVTRAFPTSPILRETPYLLCEIMQDLRATPAEEHEA
jgi:hypothetical protein